MRNNTLLISLVLVLTLIGCEKKAEKIIIGKWSAEEVSISNDGPWDMSFTSTYNIDNKTLYHAGTEYSNILVELFFYENNTWECVATDLNYEIDYKNYNVCHSNIANQEGNWEELDGNIVLDIGDLSNWSTINLLDLNKDAFNLNQTYPFSNEVGVITAEFIFKKSGDLD
jgi:hypothetical protein